ncbi:Phosphate-specific transport system accessory protein PhoU homolog [Candidatus Accumulibacter aalborgensis]|uniref:Phosphate-specific transport system accessory protein PhoU n=1 Tax=Candidatus Accumulibacter aalborgensis TaxID=1860102 RepID=A0A1A8XVP0_9PROT|nr:phosphate signaling complex protein PhoU [Candidatus Accumulibacter aalborgensis]SBT08667.1 Phosphate-specific transport system accessory protein PhoU homolog [Candidatus Accumulibacter aalborgensis]
MSDHLSKQFDLELENIRTRILQMGGLVERQVLAAVDAFSTGNLEEMQQVIDNDSEVDAYEVGIDEDCTLLIARRQPTARDLRLIMAISRIVTDLERVGDKASKIANMSRKLHLAGGQRIPRLSDVYHSGRLATDMLQGALDSLARLDVDAARHVIGSDKAIDAAFNAILRQLITYMMEDPRTISEALDIIWIAKAIERVGDHAANIAENVVYVVSGTDIRHSAAVRKKADQA